MLITELEECAMTVSWPLTGLTRPENTSTFSLIAVGASIVFTDLIWRIINTSVPPFGLTTFFGWFFMSFAFLVTDSPDNQGRGGGREWGCVWKPIHNLLNCTKELAETTGSKTPSKCSWFEVWTKKGFEKGWLRWCWYQRDAANPHCSKEAEEAGRYKSQVCEVWRCNL